jgi:glycerophosphoryl diester phosphodiesterase
MKKILLGLTLFMASLTLFAQNTEQYQGNYQFEYDGDLQEASVITKDGKLQISASLGTAGLAAAGKDTFAMDMYSGKVIFMRNQHNEVAKMQVMIPAFDIALNADKIFKLKDVQAHRGGCGLWPCNTTKGFINAVKLGVQTLEMDAVISKDKKVVVSHDPYMDYSILKPDGSKIAKEEMQNYNIYKMPYDSVKLYDAGLGGNPFFPTAEKFSAPKPLLTEVIDEVEGFIKKSNLSPVYYNIEVKSLKEDDVYHPKPEEFSDLVIEVIKNKGILEKTIIQSFDIRALKYIHQKYPNVKLAFLVANKLSTEENIKNLGFTPAIYSPNFRMVNPEAVKAAKSLGMQVIPWTVNEVSDIQNILSLDVDGIISDYPERVLKISKR